MLLSADRQPLAIDRDAHRLVEVAKVRVEPAAVAADQDHLARLVGGDRQADAEVIEHGREVVGVDAGQRSLGRGWVGGLVICLLVFHIYSASSEQS